MTQTKRGALGESTPLTEGGLLGGETDSTIRQSPSRPQAKLRGSNSLADLAARIRAEHDAAGGALKRSLQHAIAAGELLLEAKDQLKHGQWLPWLESCGISERTAQRYIRLVHNRKAIETKSDKMSDLSVSGALAMITAPRDELSVHFAQSAADSVFDQFELEVILARLDSYPKRKALFDEAISALDKIRDLHLGRPIEQQQTFLEFINNGPEFQQIESALQGYGDIEDPNALLQAATEARDAAVAWLTRVAP
jgi:hypothetical protein